MVRACTSCSCMTSPACSRRSSARCRSSYWLITPPSSGGTTWISRETLLNPLRSNNQAAHLRRNVRGLQVGLEPVARPSHGLNQLVMPCGRERLAQAADMNVHRPLFHEYMLAPDFVEQPRARENAPRMRHEEVQEAKL